MKTVFSLLILHLVSALACSQSADTDTKYPVAISHLEKLLLL